MFGRLQGGDHLEYLPFVSRQLGDDNMKLHMNDVGFDFYVNGWEFLKRERISASERFCSI
jgi:hypothetical protein